MFRVPSEMFSAVGVFWGLLLPLLIVQMIALLFIPSVLLGGGGKVMTVGKAIYCYLLQALGILLMTFGGIPALYGVLARQPYNGNTYLALLIVFASGGFTFLWHENLSRTIDSGARAIPHAIYFFTFRMLGYLLTLLSIMTLLLTMLLGMETALQDWWVMPVILFFYGMLLLWCTKTEAGSFRSQSLFPRPFPAFPKIASKGKKK